MCFTWATKVSFLFEKYSTITSKVPWFKKIPKNQAGSKGMGEREKQSTVDSAFNVLGHNEISEFLNIHFFKTGHF